MYMYMCMGGVEVLLVEKIINKKSYMYIRV